MSVIVQLSSGEHMGVEHDRVNFVIGAGKGKNTGNGVVRGVSFNGYRSIWTPVNKHWSRDEHFLEVSEGSPAIVREVPRNSFACKTSKGNHDIRVVLNEPPIKVRKAKEGLDVLDFSGFGPILNSLDFVAGHGEPGGQEDITEIFDSLQVPFAFLQFEIKSVSVEALENFPDMFSM